MSIINKSLSLIFILSAVVVPFCFGETDCDKSKCIESKVYKEIGCKPVIEEGQCCPSRYDCFHLKKIDTEKCHYKNEVYNPSDKLDSSKTNAICHADCSCLKPSKDANFSFFNCATVECPEFFMPYDPQCSYQTEKGRCCGKNKVCGEEREKLHKCYQDGLIYVENQWIYPQNATCHRCWCDKNFNNQTRIEENPNCEEVDCGVELRDLVKVQQGCIPVYFKHQGCCPIGWRCPRPEDTVIATKNESTSEHVCEFGNLKLKVGDKLETPEENVTCECIQPPMVHCIQSQ